MSDIKDLVRDIINLTSPMFKDDPRIVEGLVESVTNGYQRMIIEGDEVSFSITQKGKEYVEAMPFQHSGGTEA